MTSPFRAAFVAPDAAASARAELTMVVQARGCLGDLPPPETR